MYTYGPELKTSEEWQKLHPEAEIYDPDGWDRLNYRYSWYEEKITQEEYEQRAMQSTCLFHGGYEHATKSFSKRVDSERTND